MSLDLDRMRQEYSAWVDVDLDNLLWNYALISKKVAPAGVIPVIKGNALGFGSPVVGLALARAGAKLLAVSNFNEALELRRHKVSTGILAMNGLLPVQMGEAIRQDISFFVFDEDSVRAADDWGRALKKKARVHVKIDSGLGRLGSIPAGVPALKKALDRAGWVEATGVASHFASPYLDRDRGFTLGQLHSFLGAASIVDPSHTKKWHIAASSAILRYPETHLDAVRPGCLLHGLSRVWPLPWELRRDASYRARIVQIKELPAGHNLGYMRPDRQFFLPGDTKIAVIPIGSHDGVSAALAGTGSVLVNAKRCTILGMGSCQMMVDVSDLDKVGVGDEVVIYGKQGEDEITAVDFGAPAGISYGEVTSSLHRRVPRVYWKGGDCVAIDVSGHVIGVN